ncbi:MAG: hypothetical protein HY812_19720 [Planctomycetes bacterium]|nr:hypothetical protein [Planctomycetota bacterium]
MSRGRGALFAGLLLLPGCGEGGAPAAQEPVVEEAAAPEVVRLLSGESPPLAAFLVPLRPAPEAAEWCAARLRAIAGGGQELSFFSLRLYHLGEAGQEAVPLGDLALSFEQRGAERANVVFGESLRTPEARASALGYKALETFSGRALDAGKSFEAIVAFPGRFDLAGVDAALLRAGERAVALCPAELPLADYERLLAEPSRDIVVASLARAGARDSISGDEEPRR